MSDATKAALDAAIEAHIADEHADNTVMLRGYILQAAGNGIEDSRDCLLFTSGDQGAVVTLGLLAIINANVDASCFGDEGE